MIAKPVISEQQVHEALVSAGYEPTDITTETSRFWRNTKTGKHITVPNSDFGAYPFWLFDELMSHANILGDVKAAKALAAIDPWARLAPKKKRPAKAAPGAP